MFLIGNSGQIQKTLADEVLYERQEVFSVVIVFSMYNGVFVFCRVRQKRRDVEGERNV